MTEQDQMSPKQKDYAVFLPAISNYYATFIGKQRFTDHVDPKRIPFKGGMEGINFLNMKDGIFTYQWGLYSAGHAKLDTTKTIPNEDMIRNRDRENTWLVGDSGGFQIGKGVWEGNWVDPNDKAAAAKRADVLRWMDAYMNYGMVLDIPVWIVTSEKSMAATGIRSYDDAVKATKINNEYFINNRTGDCKFLNVLQGENHTQAKQWYDEMKVYCDPKKYPGKHFNGWAMGGQNMCDLHLILDRIVDLHFDHLLLEGVHDRMHFLGTSKLEWALILTDIQRAVRKYYNPKFTITYDCASPFVAAAKGLIYYEATFPEMGKWVYRMDKCLDDKKYAKDYRPFADVIREDLYPSFQSSPITDQMTIRDLCYMGENDLNKLGKISKSSYDAFSYAILQVHNLWTHINAVQTANQLYDEGHIPKMLVKETYDDILYIRDVIDEIFMAPNRAAAKKTILKYNSFWEQIIGTRGFTGKRTTNALTHFHNLFTVAKPEEPDQIDFSENDDFELLSSEDTDDE